MPYIKYYKFIYYSLIICFYFEKVDIFIKQDNK